MIAKQKLLDASSCYINVMVRPKGQIQNISKWIKLLLKESDAFLQWFDNIKSFPLVNQRDAFIMKDF